MNAVEVFEHALQIIGYTDFGAVSTTDIKKRCLSICNTVLADMLNNDFVPLTDCSQEIPLSENLIVDCMVFGVAMWIAQQEFDSNNQALMASYYEQKKAKLTKFDTIRDDFVKVW